MIRPLLLLAVLSLAAPAQAQDEDAEHRADRLRTIELNQRARAQAAQRDEREQDRVAKANRRSVDQSDARYREERALYERRMAEWRRQVADCRAGYYGSCDRDDRDRHAPDPY